MVQDTPPLVPRRKRTMEARFWAKVQTSGACWLWTGSLGGSIGYGQFRVDSDTIDFAHRVSWRMAFGPIPDRLLVLHRCDVPRCVRPQHLYLGTNADNSADMSESMRIRRMAKRRPPVGQQVMSLRVSDAFLTQLDEIGEKETMTRSEVIRLAVKHYYARLFNKAA